MPTGGPVVQPVGRARTSVAVGLPTGHDRAGHARTIAPPADACAGATGAISIIGG
jgi:hypothetical protein